VKELLYNPFTPRIVELFSGDGSGRLDFQQFLHMMSVFSSRASAEAKVVWAFALWDFDGKARTLSVGCRSTSSALSRCLHGRFTVTKVHQPCAKPAGDDLIGPRDIKKGLRMLINTQSKGLRESAEDLEQQQADADAEAVADSLIDSRADDANALSEDQIQEVMSRNFAKFVLMASLIKWGVDCWRTAW